MENFLILVFGRANKKKWTTWQRFLILFSFLFLPNKIDAPKNTSIHTSEFVRASEALKKKHFDMSWNFQFQYKYGVKGISEDLVRNWRVQLGHCRITRQKVRHSNGPVPGLRKSCGIRPEQSW